MSIDVIVTDGTTSGINTNVVRVISQTTETADATVNAESNKGYILTSGTLQTINLPSTPSVGDVFALHGNGAGLFKVAQAAGEQITLGDKSTTLGATGFIDSTNSGDEVYLICTDATGLWKNDNGYGGEFLIDGVTPTNTTNSTGDVTTLSSTGVSGISLVSDGTGPTLSIKKIDAGLGLGGSDFGGGYRIDAEVASIIPGASISSSQDGNNNITINNTAPDQVVVLNDGTNITVTGSYPNFTINSTGGGISMPTLIDTQTFTADGMWNKPVGAAFVNMLIIGGGGGGGSGARSDGSRRTGGIGGSYGAATYVTNYDATLLGATESVTVGAGGAGGASQTVNATAGAAGTAGDDSDISLFSSHGGEGGEGGNPTNDEVFFAGAVNAASMIIYHGQQVSSVESDTQPPPPAAAPPDKTNDVFENSIGKLCPSAGGPGQVLQVSLDPTVPGVALDYDYISAPRAQAAAATAGNPGNAGSTYESYFGTGASGGASTVSSVGYAGGAGGVYGGGGGGGGTSSNGNASGAGGNGGGGIVVVWTYE